MGIVVVPIAFLWFFVSVLISHFIVRRLYKVSIESQDPWAEPVEPKYTILFKVLLVSFFTIPIWDGYLLKGLKPVLCLNEGIDEWDSIEVEGYFSPSFKSLERIGLEGFSYIEAPIHQRYLSKINKLTSGPIEPYILKSGKFRFELVSHNDQRCITTKDLLRAFLEQNRSNDLIKILSAQMSETECMGMSRIDKVSADIRIVTQGIPTGRRPYGVYVYKYWGVVESSNYHFYSKYNSYRLSKGKIDGFLFGGRGPRCTPRMTFQEFEHQAIKAI